MLAICEDKQPHMPPLEMEGGESQEVADAIAKWARGALSLTALHPADTPEGVLDFPIVRAPDGEWAPREDSNADALLYRETESLRPRHIACANSHCVHGSSEYCARGPQERREEGQGPRIHPQGMPNGAGRDATPRQAGTPGRETRPPPGIAPGPRGYEKLALGETSAVRSSTP